MAHADVRRIALSVAEAEFQKAGLLDSTLQRSAGLRVVHALLHCAQCKDGIDMDTWNELVPNPQVPDEPPEAHQDIPNITQLYLA